MKLSNIHEFEQFYYRKDKISSRTFCIENCEICFDFDFSKLMIECNNFLIYNCHFKKEFILKNIQLGLLQISKCTFDGEVYLNFTTLKNICIENNTSFNNSFYIGSSKISESFKLINECTFKEGVYVINCLIENVILGKELHKPKNKGFDFTNTFIKKLSNEYIGSIISGDFYHSIK